MKTLIALSIATLTLGAGLAGCDVKKTQEGSVTTPRFEKTREGDVTLPKYEVTPPKVEVTKEEKTVSVPTVKTEERTIEVPKVTVTPAKDNK